MESHLVGFGLPNFAASESLICFIFSEVQHMKRWKLYSVMVSAQIHRGPGFNTSKKKIGQTQFPTLPLVWRTKCSYSFSQRLLSISKSQFGGRVTNLEPLQKLYMSIKQEQEQAEFWKLHPSVIKKFEAQNLLELARRLLEELMKESQFDSVSNFLFLINFILSSGGKARPAAISILSRGDLQLLRLTVYFETARLSRRRRRETRRFPAQRSALLL
ncbi:hypothetical protein LINPERHAP2_LOCUS9944 [Linum perenne]